MTFCLNRNLADKFLNKIRSGEINIDKLGDMSSADRRAYFESLMGKDNAKKVNALFESKLLLVEQKKGMVKWAEQVSGLTAKERKDLVAKVNSMEKYLIPKSGKAEYQGVEVTLTGKTRKGKAQIEYTDENGEIKKEFVEPSELEIDQLSYEEKVDMFLEDIASQKLGVETITMEEADNIARIAQKASAEKVVNDEIVSGIKSLEDRYNATGKAEDFEAYRKAAFEYNKSTNRLKYGAYKYMLEEYVNELKFPENKSGFKETISDIGAKLPETIKRYIKSPIEEGLPDIAKAAEEIAGMAKSFKSTLDNSFQFRQGIKTLITNPRIWTKNFVKSFEDIRDVLKSDTDALGAIRADVYSRENAINGNYKKAKLDIFGEEEAYPISLSEKLPGIFGRIFKASEVAFKGTALRSRADLADFYISKAKQNKVELKEEGELESIGKMVNTQTGRGRLGKLERVGKQVNVFFFSPKFFMSNVQTMLDPVNPNMSKFARKQSAQNLAKIVATTATVMMIAKTLDEDSVDFDPRSSDFGKIKVGNTRIDITGGMASVTTIASRIITSSTKSANSGIITALNSDDYGSRTSWDVIDEFFQNKLSPVMSIVNDVVIKKHDYDGNKPTLKGEMSNLFLPLPIATTDELMKDQSYSDGERLVFLGLDMLGLAANTYSNEARWNINTGAELTQLKEQIGDDKFQGANDKFNSDYNAWLKETKNKEEYKYLTEEQKKKVQEKKRTEIKEDIFDEYDFVYEKLETEELPSF